MLHVSTGTADLPSEHLVTTLVPGASWASQTKDLTPDDRRALRHQLGRHVAAMHHVTGPGPFGYPAPGSPLTGPTWTVAYQRIVTALLDDATRYGARLPRPVEEIHDLLTTAADDLLGVIEVPVLVHFDLWAGNIFIDRTPDGPTITGVIDHERALWADPADFASLALLGDIADFTDFLNGYRDAEGPVRLDEPTRRRLHLYRAHLALVMLVETAPRGTDGPADQPHNDAVAAWLTRQLDALPSGPSTTR